MLVYYRVQPAGLPLLDHTSGNGCATTVPPGFVFAWKRPKDIHPKWFWNKRVPTADEVVVFVGVNETEAPEAEGVLVRPVMEIDRYRLR